MKQITDFKCVFLDDFPNRLAHSFFLIEATVLMAFFKRVTLKSNLPGQADLQARDQMRLRFPGLRGLTRRSAPHFVGDGGRLTEEKWRPKFPGLHGAG